MDGILFGKKRFKYKIVHSLNSILFKRAHFSYLLYDKIKNKFDTSFNQVILYITGNEHKVISANNHLKQFSISTKGLKVDGIIEPQLDDITEISISKAKQAFEKVQKPLIVSDAGWMFTALNGFPGSYMASINKWFSPQDFLNLMKGKKNREIILRECVTYTDGKLSKTFVCDNKGIVLTETCGEGSSLDQIVTFREDGKSIAKCLNEKILGIPQNELWNEVGEWLNNNMQK